MLSRQDKICKWCATVSPLSFRRKQMDLLRWWAMNNDGTSKGDLHEFRCCFHNIAPYIPHISPDRNQNHSHTHTLTIHTYGILNIKYKNSRKTNDVYHSVLLVTRQLPFVLVACDGRFTKYCSECNNTVLANSYGCHYTSKMSILISMIWIR